LKRQHIERPVGDGIADDMTSALLRTGHAFNHSIVIEDGSADRPPESLASCTVLGWGRTGGEAMTFNDDDVVGPAATSRT